MILAVALNAALDVTYGVERLSHNEPVRVTNSSMRPGGKGVNVAWVLAELGAEVAVTGLAGGHRGELIREQLRRSGITERLFQIAGETRQTVVAVAADGTFAEYDEPGAEVSVEEWDRFLRGFGEILDNSSYVVCAGSLPAGLPTDAYATLITAARSRGRDVLLDTSGDALRAGIDARPGTVKINLAELASVAGGPLTDEAAIVGWAEKIQERGVSLVIVTLGSNGAIVIGDRWRRRIRQPVRHGSPVGAGDAFAAGLVASSSDLGIDERLAFAASLAASAVGPHGAGLVDVDLARSLVKDVEVVAI